MLRLFVAKVFNFLPSETPKESLEVGAYLFGLMCYWVYGDTWVN